MKEQILQFKQILEEHGLSIDDYELNVDGNKFRSLLAGEAIDLDVLCRSTRVNRTYHCDGSSQWLDQFCYDLTNNRFS